MKAKRTPTLLMKVVLLLIAAGILVFCAFFLPGIAADNTALNPGTAPLQYPFLIAAYIFFIPFFIALFQAFKLLNYIERNEVRSTFSAKALKVIYYCANTIIAFIVLGEVAAFMFMDGEITLIIMLGALGVLASITIAVVADLLQKLVKDAVGSKSHKDMLV
ncbi:DUF2975 domain-containing protein [Planococcus sp. CAU13]|uniref:DUF2975 domain-containing protein n=1 Tax=Planococcus sp. CAU13 TaxID=1541197 RepID=UPI00052FF602|nr:DUF2975 domain-containing protein [Planococcus sp. CAU13]